MLRYPTACPKQASGIFISARAENMRDGHGALDAKRPVAKNDTRPVPLSFQALSPCLDCLAGMVRTAQALTVAEIEQCTTVAHFDAMIGEHAMEWSSLGAAQAVPIYGLAPSASTLDNLARPDHVSGGVVVRLGLPWWRAHGACVDSADQ
jgi:hypothetical protein